MDSIHNDIVQDIALNKLSDEKRERVLAIKNGIDITDDNSIMRVGSDVSKEISALNKTVLENVKVKDIPEIEQLLPELNKAFQEVDSSTLLVQHKSFINRLFKNNSVQTFIEKFENAETVVFDIQKNLQRVEMELRKDIEIEDSLGRKNIECIQHLQECILAIQLKINDMVADIEQRQKEVDNTDFVEAQLIEEEKDKVENLSKQVYWLEQQKLLAIQTLPLLRNLRNSNKDMIRQITLTVQQSIPAWEQGIIIAFHIHRQQGALRIERAVYEMTNNIVRQNSRLIKENAIEIAKAVESGMIDLDTFHEANKNIIETSEQLARIKDDAIKSRKENIIEYKKITERLLEAEKRDIGKLASDKVGELNV